MPKKTGWWQARGEGWVADSWSAEQVLMFTHQVWQYHIVSRDYGKFLSLKDTNNFLREQQSMKEG